MTTKYRVSLAFASLPDADLLGFALNNITMLNGNLAFPTLPVPQGTLEDLATAFQQKLVAAAQGGLTNTAEKDQARADLLAAWRPTAAYVQTVAGTDLPKLLSSGFLNVSTNRSTAPLPRPDITSIENNMSTQLLVRLTPIANAKAYEVQLRSNTATWQPAGTFTQARRIVLENLTPGTTYSVQSRAVGGATGYSDWCDPVSHMAL